MIIEVMPKPGKSIRKEDGESHFPQEIWTAVKLTNYIHRRLKEGDLERRHADPANDDPLKSILVSLDLEDVAVINKRGKPDLNYLKERLGRSITRKEVDQAMQELGLDKE